MKLGLRVLFAAVLGLGGCGVASSPPEKTAPGGAGLPPGFTLGVFAQGLERPRFMALRPDGTLYVGSNDPEGKIWALPDRNHDGRADEVIVFASGLRSPHSVAWYTPPHPPGDFVTPKPRPSRGGPSPSSAGQPGWLYVGETHRVIRLRDTNGDLRADEQEVVVADLPADEMHFTRTVSFGPASAEAAAGRPDGGLYVSVGSSCNACKEAEPRRAAILRFNADGSGGEIFARGLRNAVGFTWHPQTKEMWATDNGRDWLGDDLPPEELDRIQRGGDYGWPYCYGQRVPDPQLGSRERCAATAPAIFEMPAHSAPLGLEFYTGTIFPPEYRGDLFIAFHGSWNRSVPTGYKVVRVRFRDGQPIGIEDFVDVWFQGGRVQHRPVDIKTGPDGALYISDDRGGTIFRVSYGK